MRSALEPRSKLPDVGTTIFTVIGQLAAEYDALNLSQGAPNFAPDPALIESAAVVSYQDHNQVYADLVAGRLDATLVLAPAGQKGFLSRPNGEGFAFVGQPVRDDKILGSGIAFGVRKGDDALRKQLDAAIEKLQADGTVKSLARKYLGDLDVSTK